MRLIKEILGFYSPYSWTKWLRCSFAAVALLITLTFWSEFGFVVIGGGLIGFIAAVIIFVLIAGPTMAVMLGIALLVGAVVGGIQSGKKQAQSLNESKASGNLELLDLDKLRIKVQAINLVPCKP